MNSKNILAIDIGGTHIKYAIVKFETLEIIYTGSFKTKLPSIKSDVEKIISSNKEKYNFNYVAIASMGVIDSSKKEVIYTNQKALVYKGTNFANLASKYNVKLTILNDANAAAIAENHYSKGIYKKNLTVTFGTGVGCGLINVFDTKQSNHFSGEIGYLKIARTNLDTYLSFSRFNSILLSKFEIETKDNNFIKKYFENELLRKTLKSYLYKVGDFLSNLAIYYNVNHIFVSGGISHLDPSIFNLLIDRFNKNLLNTPYKTTISKAMNLNNSGFIGACLFLKESV
ncbi:ROK family protein [Mycoplasmopsis alligatoris]|uniref:ROK family protein n=1 Tax=Mycoplasmopsis alligatoris A21JP2 TaxID=747682 RepID=D4XVE2_9BACT|nr:ROK family protein [Mycoplasmopsis alligatoris]EFF41587.1 ROK family protein [Mycoplasmopsis alligatoris A21JP2]